MNTTTPETAPSWTPKPIQYLPAAWRCGHIDHWPVNLLNNPHEDYRAKIAARDCHKCRAAQHQAQQEKEWAEAEARNAAWRASKTPEQLEEIHQQNLREYFATWGCE